MKKPYRRAIILPLETHPEASLLTESVVKNSIITSAGQEVGPSYDMSFDTDANTGKTFSSDWDQSF